MNEYAKMIQSLIAHDDSQLVELCHDMVDENGGLEAIERISNVFYNFYENYEPPEEECTGQSEHEEWKQMDDARRYREYKSDQGTIW